MMRVNWMRGLAAVLLAVSAWAQQPGAAPPNQYEPGGTYLEGADKVRWMLGQLDLTPAQKEDVESVVSVYQAQIDRLNDKEVIAQIARDIQPVAIAFVQAREEGNEARMAELREQLEMMKPGVTEERELYGDLDTILTPAQRAELAKIQERLTRRKADVALWPVDVARAALATSPTTSQRRKVHEVLQRFRATIAERSAGPQGTALDLNDEATRKRLTDQLIKDVEAVLDDAQKQTFRRKLGG